MSLQVKLAIWVASVVAVLGAISGIFIAGDHYRGAKDAAAHQIEVNAIQQVVLEQATENDTLKTHLEVQKNEENTVVDRLANHPVVTSLRLPAANCADQSHTAPGGQPAIAGAGTLPTANDDSFARFTEGLAKLALEADQLTAQCRVVTNWAAAQIQPTTGAKQ